MFHQTRTFVVALGMGPLCVVGSALAADAPAVVQPEVRVGESPSPLATADASLRGFIVSDGRPLTIEEVGKRASSSSPDAALKLAAAASAKAREDEAVANLWPRLQLQARYSRTSALVFPPFGVVPGASAPANTVITVDPATGQTNVPLVIPGGYSLPVNNLVTQATLNVPLSDYVFRLTTAIKTAEHSAAAAVIEEKAARLQAAADAKLRYLQWLSARAQARVAEQLLSQARAHERDAQRVYQAGLLSRADLLRAQAQIHGVELLLVRSQQGEALAREALRIAIRDEDKTPWAVGDDVLAQISPLPANADPDALVGEALAKRLEIRALAEGDASLASLVSLARTQQYPRVDLAGNFIYANPNPRYFPPQDRWDKSWDASVVLTWTPTDIPGARAVVREQRAKQGELAAQRQRLLDAIRMEVTQALQSVREAEASLTSAAEGLIASEESHRVRNELFRAGKATTVEVVDAQVELSRARIDLVNAHVADHAARLRLEHATGRDVL